MKEKIDGISDLLSNLVQRIEYLDERCDLLERRCTALEKDKENHVSEVAKEIELRTRRRNNVMISGLDLRSDGTLEERKADELEKGKEVLSYLGVDSENIIEVHRVGLHGKANRGLLKVILKSFEVRQDIIRNTKKIGGKYPKVFINPDRTPMEQRQNRELRLELNSRRQCGEDVIIRGGRIVSRQLLPNFRPRF